MKGIYAASITPFDSDGHVNSTALVSLMEWNLKQGADGFFLGGSSAECFLLSEKERVETFEAASGLKDRTTLVAHIGAVSTGEAIRYAKEAKRLGFHHIAATPPFYYGFSARQVAQYYYDISAVVDMPVLIYNFPGNTNRPFDLANPDTQALFRSGAVLGIKHTNLNLFQMERIRHLNPALTVMNGFDETMVAGLALGADGSIGSTFNFMLPHYKKIYDTYLSGDREGALALQVKANNIMEALCSVGLIPAIKYVLTTMGIDAGIPRRPFLPLEDSQKIFLDQVLKENLEND
ncbi:dihydrodipicolinate synthase family protein [Marasmitruncus massiliensis]|uniref:dihydrodipicolinate synthase family protein n=1 Tax=Marasmitruncus massiliensis TaxID=1944642 RepID=UPI000C79E7F0|nr:dihydrodipicolinate synthase family protein [Marasmitruncus massiliensis]